MATTADGERVQSWVPIALADELREKAAEERRSVSQVIRLAVEQSLAEDRDARRYERADRGTRSLRATQPRR